MRRPRPIKVDLCDGKPMRRLLLNPNDLRAVIAYMAVNSVHRISRPLTEAERNTANAALKYLEEHQPIEAELIN